MKDFYISDAPNKRDQVITSFFVVADKERRTRRDGQPYLALVLSDKTGQMAAKIWESADAYNDLFEQGDVVKIKAAVSKYRDRFELAVAKIRPAQKEEII